MRFFYRCFRHRLFVLVFFVVLLHILRNAYNSLKQPSPSADHLVVSSLNLPSHSSIRQLEHGFLHNCTMDSCFQLCSLGGLSVFVDETPELLYPGLFKSSHFTEIIETIKTSRYYTTDINQTCIILYAVDLLSPKSIEVNSQILSSHPSRIRWSSDRNYLVLSALLGTFQQNPSSRVQKLLHEKVIVAGGGFTQSSLRQLYDISLPVLPVDPRSIEILFNPKQQPRSHLLATLLPKVEARAMLDLMVSAPGKPLSSSTLLLFPCKEIHAEDTVRCSDNAVVHKYPAILQSTKFCLILNQFWFGSGDLLDAMKMGCIPVFLANEYVNPFSEVLDWTRASITVSLADLGRLDSIIGMVPEEKEEEMRLQVYFLYSSYFKSAKDIVLASLAVLNDRIFPESAKGVDDWNNQKFVPSSWPSEDFRYSNPSLHFTSPLKSQGFTAIILTYDRVESLFTMIRLLSKAPSLVKIIVVWNNMNVTPPTMDQFPNTEQALVVIKPKSNKLTNRFFPYSDIQTDAILAIDDDMTMVSPDEIQFGFEVWCSYPERLVGYPPRIHVRDSEASEWSYSSEWHSNLSMVLTGVAFYHRYYQHYFFNGLDQEIRDFIDIGMNCEDILMNFIISSLTGKPPIKVLHRQKFNCDNCTSSLSSKESHYLARRTCVSSLVHKLGWLPLQTVHFRTDPLD